MRKRINMVQFDLGGDVFVIMPKEPKLDDVLSAFMLLGGLLRQGLVHCRDDEADYRKAVDLCVENMKAGDFSPLAKECRKVVVFEKEVGEA